MDKKFLKNRHEALGEAVIALLDSQSALSNHALLAKLQQLAESEADEERAMLYRQAQQVFRLAPLSASGPRQKETDGSDHKTVKIPQNLFAFRRTRRQERD